MGLTQLAKMCKECPFVDTCDHKQMEALAYLTDANQTTMTDTAAPILRETMTINISGSTTTVYKDEIEKELYKSLYSGLGLHFGA